jgi:superoxide reductase
VVPAHQLVSITIKVGDSPHVVEPGHYVQFVDLYIDDAFVSRVTFTPNSVKPKITYSAVLSETLTLRVVAFCNLHGFWESTRMLQVEH